MTRSSELRQDLEPQSTNKDPGCWSGRGLTPSPPDRLTGTIQTELSGRICGLSYTQSNIKGQDLKNGLFIVLVDTLIQFLNGLIPKSDQHQFSLVKGLRDWQTLPFAVTRFHYMEVLCHIFYCYWCKENHLLDMYRGPHYIEVCCMLCLSRTFYYTLYANFYSHTQLDNDQSMIQTSM